MSDEWDPEFDFDLEEFYFFTLNSQAERKALLPVLDAIFSGATRKPGSPSCTEMFRTIKLEQLEKEFAALEAENPRLASEIRHRYETELERLRNSAQA